MNRILVTCGLFLPVLILAACGDDSTTDPGTNGGTANSITFPLALGNEWIFNSVSTPRGATADTSRIVGTEMFQGESYWVLQDSGDSGGGALLRQEGQELFVVLPDGEMARGDPLEAWVDAILNGSFPWKFAQFDAASGVSWTIAAAETTIDILREPTLISFSVTGSSLGRTSVTVPAGTYDDTYHGRITLSLEVGPAVAAQQIQEVWIHDDAGLVKTYDTESVIGSALETDTSELVSFTPGG